MQLLAILINKKLKMELNKSLKVLNKVPKTQKILLAKKYKRLVVKLKENKLLEIRLAKWSMKLVNR